MNLRHIGVIADGNRRWARAHGLPTEAGYMRGLEIIEELCLLCIERGASVLSVFCFSVDNWSRSEEEIGALFELARSYFAERTDWYLEHGIKVEFVGRRDRFSVDFLERIGAVEEQTERGSRLILRILADYGGRDEICRAVRAGARSEEEITKFIGDSLPDLDLVIRTGGRHRLSGFMLWQSAYAEIVFSDLLFPALERSEAERIMMDAENVEQNYGR